MYFKNEIMSYIQLGKTLEKSPNKSGEPHKGPGVKFENGASCGSKINSKKKRVDA